MTSSNDQPSIDTSKVVRELRRLRERFPGETDRAVGLWAENLVSEMKDESVVPRDTGRLRDAHGWKRVKDAVWELFANTSYAAAVHERHKTKARWFARTMAERGRPTLAKALEELKKRLGL